MVREAYLCGAWKINKEPAAGTSGNTRRASQPFNGIGGILLGLFCAIFLNLTLSSSSHASATENTLHASKIDWDSVQLASSASTLFKSRQKDGKSNPALEMLTKSLSLSTVPVLFPNRLFVEYLETARKSESKSGAEVQLPGFAVIPTDGGHTTVFNSRDNYNLVCRASHLTLLTEGKTIEELPKATAPSITENDLGGHTAVFRRYGVAYMCETDCLSTENLPRPNCLPKSEFEDLLKDLAPIGPAESPR